jgi:hypothetical protein
VGRRKKGMRPPPRVTQRSQHNSPRGSGAPPLHAGFGTAEDSCSAYSGEQEIEGRTAENGKPGPECRRGGKGRGPATNRYATASCKVSRAQKTGVGHPIVASFEPCEDRRWCYADGALV